MRRSRFFCARVQSSSRTGLMPAASRARGQGPRRALMATTSASEKSVRRGYRASPASASASRLAHSSARQSSRVGFCSIFSSFFDSNKHKKTLSFPSGNESASGKRHGFWAQKKEHPHACGLTAAPFFTQKCCSATRLGKYSDCHGNGGCDGFSPNFPLICRNGQNRSTQIV